ncbi:MAG: DNA internalization-related competence protein ComEC/Rec2 [Dermatophilaceae bacterium]
MTVPDLRLLLPALAAWAALVGMLWAGVPAGAPAVLAVGGLTVAGPALFSRRCRRSGWWRTAGLTGAAAALTAIALAGQLAVREAGTLDELAGAGATVVVEGTVDSDPRPVAPAAGRRVDTPVVLTELRVERVSGRGSTSEVSAPVLVLGDPSWLQTQWRQRVRVSGRLGATEAGDSAAAVLRPSSAPVVLESAGPLAEAAAAVRERFRLATSGLPGDAAALLPALVVGDRSTTPADLTEAMRASGMSHLSAVSGSNIAIVAASVLAVCRALGVRRRWRPPAVGLVVLVFVVLVRPEPSVLRAAVMGIVGLVGAGASRNRSGVPALAATVLLLLCWDPWLARSYGFALSVLATVGLMVLAGPLSARIASVLPGRLRGLAMLVAVPLAAQVMCAPVLVLLQVSVSLVAVPANLLAAALVAPATIAGVLVLLTALVWTPLAVALAWGGAIPALLIAQIARVGADVPFGTLPWLPGPTGAFLLGGLVLAGVVGGPWLAHRVRRQPVAVLGCAVLAVAAAVPTRDVAWPMPGWQVVMCDVGQGDAIVLATAPGHAVLVDAGPDPTAVDGCLGRLGVATLDAIVLTHFHADHVDGLAGALHRRRAQEVLTTPVAEPADRSAEVLRRAALAEVPVAALYAGDLLQWGGVRARVWWPARVVRSGSVPNNASLVLAAEVSGLRVLLLGDIEHESAQPVEATLRADPAWSGRVDVLKVAHHGSANRDDELYEQAGATVAVISVGEHNDYGHPAASTLHELARVGSQVHRTDQEGDLAIGPDSRGGLLVAARGR